MPGIDRFLREGKIRIGWVLTAVWRPAAIADAPAITANAQAVLGSYGEEFAVYAERIVLAPGGCFVLADSDRVVGHFLSHPWRRGRPPAMNAMLGAIPADTDCWYIHDVAVLPEARGAGAVAAILEQMARVTQPLPLALVAVGGADGYWRRHGFSAAAGDGSAFGPGAIYMERV